MEMASNLAPRLPVIYVNTVQPFCPPGNHYGRNGKTVKLFLPPTALCLCRNHHKTVHTIALHDLQAFLLMVRVVASVKQDQTITPFPCLLLNIFYQVSKKALEISVRITPIR